MSLPKLPLLVRAYMPTYFLPQIHVCTYPSTYLLSKYLGMYADSDFDTRNWQSIHAPWPQCLRRHLRSIFPVYHSRKRVRSSVYTQVLLPVLVCRLQKGAFST